MNLRRIRLVVLMGLFGCALATAQVQTSSLSSAAEQTGIAGSDPEDAFLSPGRYTNAYFGFQFDIPPEARLKPIPAPAALDRRVQLLEMVGPAPQRAAISISAYEYKGKNWTDAKGILRKQLDQELYRGVEELHGLSKTTIADRQFYYYETRKGVTQHVAFATEFNGYVVLTILQADDPGMVKDLKAEFSRLELFPPHEARKYAGPLAAEYEGPAVSSQRLRELRESPPAEHMDPGKIEGNVYRNAQIGLRYEVPKGWSIQPQGAVEPAVLRYREQVSGEPIMGPRERAVVKACRRTLLSAWKSKPGPDGEVPYDEFGEVTLSAMPLSCFPNLHFPDDPHDVDGVRRFLLGLSFAQPIQRDMTDARTFEASGKTLVLTHGTIAYKEQGDALSRRISVAVVLAQQRGYLLAWLFAAPHDAELRDVMNAKMGFDSDAVTTEAKASAASSPKKSTALEVSAPTETEAAAAAHPASDAPPLAHDSPISKSQSVEGSAPASDPMAYRPTLLKPGETVEEGQPQAKPSPKGSSH